jgi:hypothetical protein
MAKKILNHDRGNYRSIYNSIWDDPDFMALEPDAKLVFFFLRTSPLANQMGIFRFYKEAISEYTGLSDTVVDRVLDTLCDTDLPPVVVPSFKLELGSSQARDPGGA